jgi:predicted transcriptional regulator YdeE
MEVDVITKPAFHAVGVKRLVTFEEAKNGELHGVIQTLQHRWQEIPHVVHPERMLALSHPVTDTDFTFHIMMEVSQVRDELPEGMTMKAVPTLTYAVYHHEQGRNIEQSYATLNNWIKEQGFSPDHRYVTHLEMYPMDLDLNTPSVEIWIPIKANRTID